MYVMGGSGVGGGVGEVVYVGGSGVGEVAYACMRLGWVGGGCLYIRTYVDFEHIFSLCHYTCTHARTHRNKTGRQGYNSTRTC